MSSFLVVDDAAFMRRMISDILKKAGHSVIGEAVNGNEAIKIYKDMKPDMITMDITMPDMDGITAVKEIMKIDNKAKVIMCSAMGQEGMVKEAIRAGARDFVVKPFNHDRVIEAINKIM